MKHMSKDDDEDESEDGVPPQLVSGEYTDYGGYMDRGVLECMVRMERMEGKGTAAGPHVYCSSHVQGQGQGAAASYGPYSSNQAAEGINRRLKAHRKAETPVPIQPIPELDLRRLISSKVASSCHVPSPTAHVVVSCCSALDPPGAGIIRPRPRRRAARYAYTFQSSRGMPLNSCCMLLC